MITTRIIQQLRLHRVSLLTQGRLQLVKEKIKECEIEWTETTHQSSPRLSIFNSGLFIAKLKMLLLELETLQDKGEQENTEIEEGSNQVFRLVFDFLVVLKKLQLQMDRTQNEQCLLELLEKYIALDKELRLLLDLLGLHKRHVSDKLFAFLEELQDVVEDLLFFFLFISMGSFMHPALGLMVGEVGLNVLSDWLKNRKQVKPELTTNLTQSHSFNEAVTHPGASQLNRAMLFANTKQSIQPPNHAETLQLTPSNLKEDRNREAHHRSSHSLIRVNSL